MPYDSQKRLTNVTRVLPGRSQVTTYAYSSYGNKLTNRTDAVNDNFRFAYSTNSASSPTGWCTSVAVGTGNYYQHSLYYNTNAGISTVDYTGRGRFTNYFDAAFRLTQVTDGTAPLCYDYDTNLNIVTEYEVDTSANRAFYTYRDYDGAHNVTNVDTCYNSAGTNGSRPVAPVMIEWDSSLNLPTQVTDANGAKQGFSYANGSLETLSVYCDASNSYDTTFGYTTNGLLSAITNANGHWVRYSHDSYGNTTSVVPQIGPSVQMKYSQLGFVTNILSAGREIKLDVNELGWVNSVTYPDGLDESFLYDNLGSLTNHIDRAGRITRCEYLPTRKLTSVFRPLASGAVVTNLVTYDQQMRTLVIRDALDRAVESYALDIWDRPMSVTNLEGQTMTLDFWGRGVLDSVTRFDGTVVSNMYGTNGLPWKTFYPGGINTYSYYSNGLMRSADNGSGVITNSYNFANRLTNSTAYALASCPFALSYAYLPAGNLSAVTSLAGAVTYGYDEAERLTNITASSALASCRFALAYSVTNGLLDTMTCTNTGLSVAYEFDNMDRLTNIVWRNGTSNLVRRFAYSYNSASMITNRVMTDDGGRTRETAYILDELDRLTGERRMMGTSVLSEVEYSFDAVGNRTQKTWGDETVSYTYSSNCNRLTGWTATGAGHVVVEGTSSEAIGTHPNLGQLFVSNALSGCAVTPSLSGSDFAACLSVNNGTQQVIAAIGDAAGNVGYATSTVSILHATNGTYLYNTAGCVTSMTYSGAGFAMDVGLTWNGLYQLTAVTTNGTTVERNGYDVMGRRAWYWQAGGETNYFVYDGAQVIADVNSTGGLIRTYTWGPGIDNLLAMTVYTGATAQTYYPITDHLGTIHALVNSMGSVRESYQFDAWGRVLGVYDGTGNLLTSDLGSLTSALGNRYLWQGREYSFETGFYYFRARWYDPITGRWLSNDPIGISGGLNQYAAFGNNPVNFVDPSGRAIVGIVGWLAGQKVKEMALETVVGGAVGFGVGFGVGLVTSEEGGIGPRVKNGLINGTSAGVGGAVGSAVSSIAGFMDLPGGVLGGLTAEFVNSKLTGTDPDYQSEFIVGGFVGILATLSPDRQLGLDADPFIIGGGLAVTDIIKAFISTAAGSEPYSDGSPCK